MAIIKVDERGRITIPKEFGIRGIKTVIIPAGSFFIIIPLPKIPYKEAEGWLSTEKSREDLKILAERVASEDAIKRTKRRRQL